MNIKYFMLVNGVFSTMETANPYFNSSTIISTLMPSEPMITTKNSFDNSYLDILCSNSIISYEMKEFYDDLGFKYEYIIKSMKDMLAYDILSQDFSINYVSFEKIFFDKFKSQIFLTISLMRDEIIAEEINTVNYYLMSRIKKFINSYVTKKINNSSYLFNNDREKEDKINQIVNDVFFGKSCPVMFSQLYTILTLQQLYSELQTRNYIGKLENDELNLIQLRDIILILFMLDEVDIKMNSEEFINEFNLMIKKRVRSLENAGFGLYDICWSNQSLSNPISWPKRMNAHLKYESKLSTIKRLFMLKVGVYGSRQIIDESIEAISLIIDTIKKNKFDQESNNEFNTALLNIIEKIKNSYYKNEINLKSTEVIQNTNTRISFIQDIMQKKYVLNMIFFDDQNETNNDAFLYSVRSDHVLNVYKVLNSIKFKPNYNQQIERLDLWTLTDEYDFRMNIDMIKDNDDIIDIATAVLSALRDLEKDYIFYFNIGFDDIVVCNITDPVTKTVSRKYKLDLRRAFKVDRYELKILNKGFNFYHDREVEDFMTLYRQMINHLRIPEDCFRDFIDLSKKTYNTLPNFEYILQNVPQKIEEISFD